jgi:hypothetical protein
MDCYKYKGKTFEREAKKMRATGDRIVYEKPSSLFFYRFFAYFFINGKSKSPPGLEGNI